MMGPDKIEQMRELETMTPSVLEKYIIDEEGFSRKPYRCTAGRLTIGYGFNLDDTGLSREESLLVLRHRLGRLEGEIARKLPWYDALNLPRRCVLVGMAYQMGLAGLLGFKQTLAYAEAGRYAEAAAGMLASKWARQTPARARRAAYMMRYGKFPEAGI